MPYINFKAHGITLWAEYRHISNYDEPELVALSLDKDSTNIEPLCGSDIIELAYKAIELDIADIEEYRRESIREMRYYDEQS